jgi:hypothetical protein
LWCCSLALVLHSPSSSLALPGACSNNTQAADCVMGCDLRCKAKVYCDSLVRVAVVRLPR